MKKFIAAILCLGFLATPSFSCGRYDKHCGHKGPKHHPPRIEKHYYGCNCHHKCNHSTTALATVAGIAGLAAIITAVVD